MSLTGDAKLLCPQASASPSAVNILLAVRRPSRALRRQLSAPAVPAPGWADCGLQLGPPSELRDVGKGRKESEGKGILFLPYSTQELTELPNKTQAKSDEQQQQETQDQAGVKSRLACSPGTTRQKDLLQLTESLGRFFFLLLLPHRKEILLTFQLQ